MKIATILASFPVFQLTSRVMHQTPRRPTAIERMLIRLSSEHAASTEIGQMSIGRIFSEMLCVPDAAILVAPCLEELVVLDVLTTEESSPDLQTVSLSNFSLTQRGREMLARGQLPGTPTEAVVSHVYNPIGNIAWPGSKRTPVLTSEPLVAHADAELFAVIEPGPAVRASLPRESFAWLSPQTEIDSVECIVEGAKWRELKLEVEVDTAGALRVTAPADTAAEAWLRQLDGDQVWASFLADALGADDEAPSAALLSARKVLPVRELHSVIRDGSRAAVQVTSSSLLPEDAMPATGTIQLVLEPGGLTGAIEWNEKADGARVRLDVVPVAGFVSWWLPGRDKAPVVWTLGRVPLTCAGSQHLTTLAIESDEASALAHGLPLVSALAEALRRSGDPFALALLARLEPVESVLDEAFERFTGLKPNVLVDRANAFRLRVEAITGARTLPAQWEARMRPALTASVHALPTELSERAIADALGAVKSAGVRNAADLQATVVSLAAPPANLAELRTLRNVVGAELQLPARFLSREIAREVVNEAFSVKAFAGGPSQLEQLCSVARAILDSLGAEMKADPRKLAGDDALQATLRTIGRRTLELLAKWRTAANEVRASFADVETLAGTTFDLVSTRLSDYQAYVARITEIDTGPGRPVVIDTNALVDFPELLICLGRDELPVLPKRVLDELDRKKSDPACGDAVAAAIRAIHDAGSRVRYVEGDMTLLPRDYRSSSDNLILSVAMKLRLRDPLLVTGDVNLHNKARAQNLRVRTAKGFIDERTPRAPSSRTPK